MPDSQLGLYDTWNNALAAGAAPGQYAAWVAARAAQLARWNPMAANVGQQFQQFHPQIPVTMEPAPVMGQAVGVPSPGGTMRPPPMNIGGVPSPGGTMRPPPEPRPTVGEQIAGLFGGGPADPVSPAVTMEPAPVMGQAVGVPSPGGSVPYQGQSFVEQLSNIANKINLGDLTSWISGGRSPDQDIDLMGQQDTIARLANPAVAAVADPTASYNQMIADVPFGADWADRGSVTPPPVVYNPMSADVPFGADWADRGSVTPPPVGATEMSPAIISILTNLFTNANVQQAIDALTNHVILENPGWNADQAREWAMQFIDTNSYSTNGQVMPSDQLMKNTNVSYQQRMKFAGSLTDATTTAAPTGVTTTAPTGATIPAPTDATISAPIVQEIPTTTTAATPTGDPWTLEKTGLGTEIGLDPIVLDPRPILRERQAPGDVFDRYVAGSPLGDPRYSGALAAMKNRALAQYSMQVPELMPGYQATPGVSGMEAWMRGGPGALTGAPLTERLRTIADVLEPANWPVSGLYEGVTETPRSHLQQQLFETFLDQPGLQQQAFMTPYRQQYGSRVAGNVLNALQRGFQAQQLTDPSVQFLPWARQSMDVAPGWGSDVWGVI